METVTWFDATNYCGKLTQRERAAGRIATNSVYRLPTEAEWEYACRAWTSTRFSYGDDPGYTNLTNYAWYATTAAERRIRWGRSCPTLGDCMTCMGMSWSGARIGMVGTISNQIGSLPGGIVLDPQGLAKGDGRVVRGGSINPGFASSVCRSGEYASTHRRTSLGMKPGSALSWLPSFNDENLYAQANPPSWQNRNGRPLLLA